MKTVVVPELLPCPFCGADGELTHGGHGEMLVRCSAIPCSAGLGGNCWQTTKEDAYAAWNRRASPPASEPVPDERTQRTQCQRVLREQGSAYPRTCQVCKFGPCRYPVAKSPAVATASEPVAQAVAWRAKVGGQWFVSAKQVSMEYATKDVTLESPIEPLYANPPAAAPAVEVPPDDDTDPEAIAWAYQKLNAFAVGTVNADSAMMMDRLRALLAKGRE